MLGIKPRSPARVMSPLKHGVISPVPSFLLE